MTKDIKMIFGDLLIWCVLAQVESFTILHSCITNIHTFQHGHPEHSRKYQVWTIQSVLITLYFLDFKNDNIAKGCQILDWRQSKLFENIWCHFHALMLDNALVYTGIHYRFSQIKSFHVNGLAAAGIVLKTFSTILETFMPLDNWAFYSLYSSY